MAQSQLIAPLPLMQLDAGARVIVDAIDPSTGASVAGVVVSDVTIYATNITGGESSGGSVFAEPQVLLAFEPGPDE